MERLSHKKVVVQSIDDIINLICKEFKIFTHKSGSYSYQSAQFENEDALAGKSHIWYEINKLPITNVLGFVACHTSLKRLGIESIE